MKKENLVQKAQQLENRSASWVGKLCMVRIYFFVHRQRAHARVRFRADMVDGPLSLIKKMSGLINQHAAPSRAAVIAEQCCSAILRCSSSTLRRFGVQKKHHKCETSVWSSPMSGEDGGEKREARTPPAVEESWSNCNCVCVCLGCENSFSWKPHCGQDISHGLDAASVPLLWSLAVQPARFSAQQDLQLLRW